MFTGLIQEVGTIELSTQVLGGRSLVIACRDIARDLCQGDSVSVSGVCLTALDITSESFRADLAQETLDRTSLAQLAIGAPVNLELAARADTRLGGHIVQGHVDGVATLLALTQMPQSPDWQLVMELPVGAESGVVDKGSITVEGISLTVAQVQDRRVNIAVIPHTYANTNLRSLKPGAPLNIELDILSKYAGKKAGESSSGLTIDELMRQGF